MARRRRIYAYLRCRHRKLANLHLPLNRIRQFRSIKLEHVSKLGFQSVKGEKAEHLMASFLVLAGNPIQGFSSLKTIRAGRFFGVGP